MEQVATTGSRELPRYSVGEEWANGLIHGLGALLSVAGLVMMVMEGARLGSARTVFACVVFGLALILMYSASTLYHAVPHVRHKQVLRRIDHIAIFLLIAGTYTPFALLVLAGERSGWTLFAATWGLAAAGAITEFTRLARHRWIAALIYVGIGWIGIFAFSPLKSHLAIDGVHLVLAGGVIYTAGVPFYLWRRLPYHHAVWHLFVLGGSFAHFLAVWRYVVPLAGGAA